MKSLLGAGTATVGVGKGGGVNKFEETGLGLLENLERPALGEGVTEGSFDTNGEIGLGLGVENLERPTLGEGVTDVA